MSDDFDTLFDEYKKKKMKKQAKRSGRPVFDAEEDLPMWKEVKDVTPTKICTICRRKLEDLDIVEACPSCQNYFHYKHWREWMKIKNECPICKQ